MSKIFSMNKFIISDLLNRFIDCMQVNEIYVYGNVQSEINGVHRATLIKKVENMKDIPYDSLSYLHIDCISQLDMVKGWMRENMDKQDFVVYSRENNILKALSKEIKVDIYPVDIVSALTGSIMFFGKNLGRPLNSDIPKNFRALAIVHFYNEQDVLYQTVQYILNQKIDVYLIDNWSDDKSYEIAREIQREYPERVYLERFPETGKTKYYEWYQQLQRTEKIQTNMNYNWYIHYDADEIRECPWREINLLQFLYHVDQLGYNLVENTVIEYKLVDLYDDIFMENAYFDFGHKETHFQQIKTWKHADSIDLKSSGGHIASIEYPRIFPLKILNRHYPFRNIEQAKKKVFTDRKLRFMKEKKERGWHGHYDTIKSHKDLISDKSMLLKWNDDTRNMLYIPLYTGCGILRENREKGKDQALVDNKEIYKGKKIIIYGAGNVGREVYKELYDVADIIAWVDSAYQKYGMVYGNKILSFDDLDYKTDEYILVAVKNSFTREEIKQSLIKRNVLEERILFIF